MPKVLGWSSNSFSAKNIGMLFPKKEWWIDSIVPNNFSTIWRGSIGGSKLHDHRAKHIIRSLKEAGVSRQELIQVFGEGKLILAVCEQATINNVPEKAQGVEWKNDVRVGQPLNSWLARWQMVCESEEDIALALQMGAQTFLINPVKRKEEEEWKVVFPSQFEDVNPPPYTTENLCESTHRLLGERTRPKDRARYLGYAIWDIITDCDLLILLHADKHGECLGLYAEEEMDLSALLHTFSIEKELVLVPFSIPVMNGRWNRSVRDFLRTWDSESGEFPILIFKAKEVETKVKEDAEPENGSDNSEDSEEDVEDGEEESGEEESGEEESGEE